MMIFQACIPAASIVILCHRPNPGQRRWVSGISLCCSCGVPEHGHPPHAAATRCSARRARQGPGAVASRRRSGIRSATSARTRYAFDIFTADGDLTAGLSGGDHAAFTLSTQRLKPAMKPNQRRRGCAVRAAPGRQQPPIRGDCRRDRRWRRHPASARSGPPAPPDTADPLRSGPAQRRSPLAPQGSVATIRPLRRDRRHDPHGSQLGSMRRRPDRMKPTEVRRTGAAWSRWCGLLRPAQHSSSPRFEV